MRQLTAWERQQRTANLRAAEQEIEEIEAYGYQIHKFTEWHWRITKKPDYKNDGVDVWPTTRKVMDRETFTTYQLDPKELIVERLNKIFRKYMP